jgi:hypothetical protein
MTRLGVIAFLVALAVAWPAAGTAATPRCSASGMSAKLPRQSLPAKVAASRARIAAAAVRCDYAALVRIAAANPNGFSFTFGAERSPAR